VCECVVDCLRRSCVLDAWTPSQLTSSSCTRDSRSTTSTASCAPSVSSAWSLDNTLACTAMPSTARYRVHHTRYHARWPAPSYNAQARVGLSTNTGVASEGKCKLHVLWQRVLPVPTTHCQWATWKPSLITTLRSVGRGDHAQVTWSVLAHKYVKTVSLYPT